MLFGVIVPFLGLVTAIVLLWGRAVGWVDLALVLGLYSFTISGVTIGFHRMFTHRALRGGPVLRFILGVAGSMSVQGSVLEWCAVHREHHKHSDRDGDPHSPHLHEDGFAGMMRGMVHAHLGWLFSQKRNPNPSVIADLIADPVLVFVDRFSWVWIWLGWVLPAVIAGLIFRTWSAAFYGFIWGGLARTFLLHHVTWSINSVCHVWGRRRFETPDHSRNNAVFGVLAFGEGWHNNHHAFPTSARHGFRWWQVDFTYWMIRGLKALGLVWDVRLPTPAAIQAKERGGSAPLPVRPAKQTAAAAV